MTKRLLVLIGGSALLWGVVVVPAVLLGGAAQLLPSAAALALVLVPAAATLVWVSGTHPQAPDMRLLAALGSSGLRLMVGLSGGVALALAFPETFDVPFWIWLVVLYLGVLTLEMAVLLRATLDQPSRASSSVVSDDGGGGVARAKE